MRGTAIEGRCRTGRGAGKSVWREETSKLNKQCGQKHSS